MFLLGLVMQSPEHDAMSMVNMFVQMFVCLTGEVQHHRLGLRVGVHVIPKVKHNYVPRSGYGQ